MQERYKKLGLNTVWVFVGKAGGSIIGLLMLPFYTHYLATEEYGTTDLITTYAGILMSILSCCIADSIFIFPKDADDKGKTQYYSSGFVFAGIMTCFIGAICYVLYYFSNKYGWESVLFNRIWFILAFAVCQFLQQYTQSFTRSLGKMKVYSGSGVVYVGFIALFSLYLLPRYGLNGYLFAMIMANVVSSVYTVIASQSYHYLSIIFDKNALLDLLRYGIPLIPNSLMWWLVNGLNRPVMEANLGLEALGIYAVANKFPFLLSTLVGIFSTAWSITMLEEFGKPDFNHFFNRTVRMLYFVMIIGACIIAACSKLIIMVFADSAYYEAWKYVPVLTLGIIFQNFSGTIGGVFMAERTSKYFFYSSIWGAVSSVLATLLFVKMWGILGAAIAVVISFLVMSIVRLVYSWKHINEMNIWWYCLMTLLYVTFIIVVLIDAPLFVNIPLYLAIIVTICFFGKNEIVPVWNTIKEKVINKV